MTSIAAAVLVAGFLSAGTASAATFNFANITGNDAGNAAAGEAQLYLDVNESFRGGENTVDFVLRNTDEPGVQMLIRRVFFDFGGPPPMLSGGAVDLTQPATTAGVVFSKITTGETNLPGGNTVSFETDEAFGSTTPRPNDKAVAPGEQLTIWFALGGNSFASLLTAITTGEVKVGLHVIAFQNGGSEAFTAVAPIPLPAGGWLLLTAIGGLGAAGLRRRRKAA
jgi:hypothetical protein